MMSERMDFATMHAGCDPTRHADECPRLTSEPLVGTGAMACECPCHDARDYGRIDAQMFEGFRIGRLREVFHRVTAGMRNWKDRIDAHVRVQDATVLEIEAAVLYFTGSAPEVFAVGRTPIYRVTAAGYYATVGA